jgi:K+-transporting ATPase ATPase C chain
MIRLSVQSIRLLAVLTLLMGIAYPLLMTGVAQVIFPHEANGSLLSAQQRILGSELVGQKFTDPKYFWPRPSATDYNPLPSSGSNLGPTSATLADLVSSRRTAQNSAHGDTPVPPELLYASGSGLDPHISPAAALYQVDRVARARGWDAEGTAELRRLIDRHIEGRTIGFLGDPRVNVLLLNLALDSLGSDSAGQ